MITVALTRIRVCRSFSDTVRNVDLICEAVVDVRDIKLSVLKEVERCSNVDRYVFATNSMTIPLRTLRTAAANPSRIISLRWLAPVLFIPFLEVFYDQNDPAQSQLVDQIVTECSRKLDKTVFECPMDAMDGDNGMVNGVKRLRLSPEQIQWHQRLTARKYEELHTNRLSTRTPLAHLSKLGGRKGSLGSSDKGSSEAHDTSALPLAGGGFVRDADEHEHRQECIICCDQPAQALLIDCGHQIMCMSCASTVNMNAKSCPMCRTPTWLGHVRALS